MPGEWVDAVAGSGDISRLALPVIVPVTEFRDTFGVALTNMIAGGDPAEELKKATEAVQAGAREERKGLMAATTARSGRMRSRLQKRGPADTGWPPITGLSSIPALVVVRRVIVFPWAFTIWMSVNELDARPAAQLRRHGQLPAALAAIRASGNRSGHTLWLHAAVGRRAAVPRHARGADLRYEISAARLPARHLRHADDGDAGRHRAGLDDDVPSAARRAQLSAVAGRHPGRRSGSSTRTRSFPRWSRSRPGSGRRW